MYKVTNSIVAQSASSGALSTIFAAASEEMEGVNGKFVGPNLFNFGNTEMRQSSANSYNVEQAKMFARISAS